MALRTLAKLSLRLTTREADAVSQDPDPDVRLALAQLAGKLVDPPEPTFARLAEDADPAVRHAAGLHQDLEQARRLFLDRDAWQR
jgi:hypothetical protein